MQNFHVGLPCLKLSLSPSNQKHHGKAARTCSVKDAWSEMNDDRRGRDKTIDHSLTEDNVWLCGDTNMDMVGTIQAEIDKINEIRAGYGKRKMRIDSVSAIELIQKPPMELMETLNRNEQIKLLKASDEVVESILHDWQPEWKTLATVIHFDEFGGKAGHPHKIFMPISRDEDGCPVLNAKRDFNLKFFTFMNREYPSRMREKGYPVLDCQIYEDMSEEQRIEHEEKKKDYGLEGYEYKRKKAEEQEAKIESNERIIENQEELLSRQKEESKELQVQILSKKQVLELKEPSKTLDGQHYKVPVAEYKNVLATAEQADKIKRDYKKREAALDKREADIESKRRLPIKERMELAALNVLKDSIVWLSKQELVPASIRRLLQRALGGEDLSKTMGVEVIKTTLAREGVVSNQDR